LVEQHLPSTGPINKVQTSKRRAKVDDSIDNSHGKRINGSNVANKNGTVCRSKRLTSRLLEKVHGDNNSSSSEVLSLEQFKVVSLLWFMFQRVLKRGKLLVDLGFGLFSLS